MKEHRLADPSVIRLEWAPGDEPAIGEYIRTLELEDQRLDQMNLWR